MYMNVYGGVFAGSAILLFSAVVTPFLSRKRKFAAMAQFLLVPRRRDWLSPRAAWLPSARRGAAGIESWIHSTAIPGGRFSALFMVLISFMSAVTAFYSIGYMEHYAQYGLGGYFASYPLFVLGMIGIVIVDDLSLGFTVAWQLMTIASFLLIRFDHRDRDIVPKARTSISC